MWIAPALLITGIYCTKRPGGTNSGIKNRWQFVVTFCRHHLEWITVVGVRTYRPVVVCVSSCDSIFFNECFLNWCNRCWILVTVHGLTKVWSNPDTMEEHAMAVVVCLCVCVWVCDCVSVCECVCVCVWVCGPNHWPVSNNACIICRNIYNLIN